MTDDEELPEINLLLLLAKKGVCHHLAPVFVNNCAILSRQPGSHSKLKLWNGHRIAMPLVANQLVIEFRES